MIAEARKALKYKAFADLELMPKDDSSTENA